MQDDGFANLGYFFTLTNLELLILTQRECYCYHAGISWFEAKTAIIRPAVRAYLANPLYTLPATA